MASAAVEKAATHLEPSHAGGGACCGAKGGPGYASPLAAMEGPREGLLYVTCVYNGTVTRR